VVVSVNHRLNVFGYLDLSEYGEKYSESANVGMLDLVAALEWVRDNIENFGGDRNNITICGQSGGAAKVTTLMAMPTAKGLFHKALIQSNSTVQVSEPSYSKKLAELVLAELNIGKHNIADIHKVPTTKLLEAGLIAETKLGPTPKNIGRFGWQPVVDGKIVPVHPFDPLPSSISAHIPLMIGTARNESSPSINDVAMESIDENGLLEKLINKYPRSGKSLYQAFRHVHPFVKPVEILSYISPYNPMAFLQAQRRAEAQHGPTFLYMFNWKTTLLSGRPRAFHCSDIPFMFYNTQLCETYTGATEEALMLSQKMASALLTFARTGNPNHKKLVNWPEFTLKNKATMVFDNISKVVADPDSAARELLTHLIYNKET
jgi:para-nitrobenzyl esterase